MPRPTLPRPARWPAAAVLLLALAGCGKDDLYPVRGKVVFPDGSPMTAGKVILHPAAEGQGRDADADIQPDGTFEARTATPGDGVAPGRYKVVVKPPKVSEKPQQVVDPKHLKFETTGLEVTVRPEPNENVTLTVARFGKKR